MWINGKKMGRKRKERERRNRRDKVNGGGRKGGVENSVKDKTVEKGLARVRRPPLYITISTQTVQY